MKLSSDKERGNFSGGFEFILRVAVLPEWGGDGPSNRPLPGRAELFAKEADAPHAALERLASR